MAKEIKSHHVGGGYWAHIQWTGDRGVDLHGRHWINRINPHCETLPWLKAYWESLARIIQLTGKTKLV